MVQTKLSLTQPLVEVYELNVPLFSVPTPIGIVINYNVRNFTSY